MKWHLVEASEDEYTEAMEIPGVGVVMRMTRLYSKGIGYTSVFVSGVRLDIGEETKIVKI